jgi:threonine dehydratase
MLSIPAVIVMPHDAPRGKLQATRAYGAEVISYDRYREDREALGRKLAAERGMTVIPPFDHPHVIAGQGTAAFELFHQIGPLDLLVTCLGGGGLTAGCALAAQALSPGCGVIAVEPEAGNDVQQSLAAGSIVRIETPMTIADGAQTQSTGALVFPILQALVREVVTVSDRQLIATMRFFAERMKQVIEPTGCLAAAAVLEGVIPVRGRRVGIVLSGGNVDAARFAELLLQDTVQDTAPERFSG